MIIGQREEFPELVKRTLAQRVSYRCSNPTCGAATGGPQVDFEKSLNVGVAAHITAASTGGPRYNPELTEQQRGSAENGIWLCQTCAKLIDNDPVRFSESLIRHWKQVAEQHALTQIGRASPFDKTYTPHIIEWVSHGDRVPPPPVLSGQTKAELVQELISDSLRSEIGPFDNAELFAEGLGALGQRYAIVGLAANHGWDWTILLFDASELGWELILRILLEGQKGWVPEVSYVTGIPGALVLTHLNGYGTGVSRRSTTWYRIAKGSPSPLISYPHTFHVYGWGMPFGRKLTSRALDFPAALDPGAKLTLLFTIAYEIFTDSSQNDDDSRLFSRNEQLSLEWNAEAQMFLPSTSSDDFSKIEEAWADGTSEFIAHNIEQLLHLVELGNARQKDFIRENLLPEARPEIRARFEGVMNQPLSET